MAATLEEGDTSEIRRALNTVARSFGITAVAEEAGLGRESLYKALGDNGNPEFATVLKLMKAMALKLSALPVDKGWGGSRLSPLWERLQNRRLSPIGAKLQILLVRGSVLEQDRKDPLTCDF